MKSWKKCGIVVKSDEKLEKVWKSVEKWEKWREVAKVGNSEQKWAKVAKRFYVAKSGEKWFYVVQGTCMYYLKDNT